MNEAMDDAMDDSTGDPAASPRRVLGAGDYFPDLVLRHGDQAVHSADLCGGATLLAVFRDPEAATRHAQALPALLEALAPGHAARRLQACFVEDGGHAAMAADAHCHRIERAGLQALLLEDDAQPVRLLLLGRDLKIGWAGGLEQARAQAPAIAAQLLGRLRADAGSPPVLVVADALPHAFCDFLVAHYQASGNQIDGRVGLSDPQYDPSRKQVSHVNLDPALGTLADRHLVYSLLPMLERCHGFRATHRVSYKVSLYDAARKGFFYPHRDNSDLGMDYRRYALVVELDDGWEGGGLSFPEFGDRLYRAGKGNATIFPVSLLHQVLPIQSGKRHVLLSFLYDGQGARLRRAEMANPAILDTTYPDAFDPATMAQYGAIYAPEPRFSPKYVSGGGRA